MPKKPNLTKCQTLCEINFVNCKGKETLSLYSKYQISRISILADYSRFNCLDADIDDTQQEVEDVAGLVVLAGPVVGIVLDERFLVLGDGVTLHV